MRGVVELGSVVELRNVVAVGKAGKTLKKAHNQLEQWCGRAESGHTMKGIKVLRERRSSWTQVPDEKVINSMCHKV